MAGTGAGIMVPGEAESGGRWVGIRLMASGAWLVEGGCASVYALGNGPAGDVVTAILQVDSRLRVIHRKIEAWSDEKAAAEAAPGGTLQAGAAAGERSGGRPPDMPVVTGAEDARDLLDGYCTVIYVIIQWAREADGGTAADALAEIVRMLLPRLTLLKRVVPRSAIPTMIALVTAAAMEGSPQRWRDQYAHVWSEGDVAALEATTVCLAEWVNTAQGSPDAALRLIMDAYERAISEG
jgi:hypothetical protein